MDLEDIIINAPIMGALENMDIPERRRRFYIREDPFELSNKEFVQLFRLNKAAATNLIEIVEPHLIPQTRRSAIDYTTKVITALRFFASGSYQMNIGKNIYMGVSQPTVSRCIHEIIDIITREEIMNQWIKFPSTLAELNKLQTQFYRKFEFQICDWRLKIMHINVRYPGSTHDAFIWNNSNAKKRYGDSGYSLSPWMMIPIIGAIQGSPEALYNKKQMKCRSLIEQCNGLLKMRFRCLLKHRVLHYSPPIASKIIYMCCTT